MQFCHRHSLRFRHLAEGVRAPAADGPKTAESGRVADEVSASEAEGALRGKLAELLLVPAASLDPGQPLVNYGVDSLMAVELVTWAAGALGVTVSQLDILSGMTAAQLLAKARDVR